MTVKKAPRSNTEKPKKGLKVGLLASMLVIFLSALVVSISLTILLFTLLGRTVYWRVLANGMCPQARMLAETTSGLITGSVNEENFQFMMRSSETTVIVLDEKMEPYAFSEPGRDDKLPEKPGSNPRPGGNPAGERPMDGVKEGRFDAYMNYCRSKFPEVMASERYSEFTAYEQELGVIAALPVKASDGSVLGALYMIKPLHDIEETAHSVQIVLMISSGIVAVLMVVPIYLVSRRLTDPLRKLNAVASDYSAGNFSGRVEPDGSKEISELGETFNELADNLQKNIGDLVIERNRLRAVFDGLGEGIIAFDTAGVQTRFNESAAKLLSGDAEADITALPVFDEIRSTVREAMERDSANVRTLECGEKLIRVSAASIDEENGRVAGAVALLMDVTEAERLEQTRRDYVANVSHELRTPLASIRGIADMLCDGMVKSDADKTRYYGYIQRESIRLSTLINDLLELSRLQSGGVALKLRRMELCELITDVADRMIEPASARGMHIDLEIPKGRCMAYSNPDRVEQALVSLMDNAVKHGSEGGTITVGMDEAEDKWLIFAENPAEIAEEDVDHLFERFYKADKAHTGEGTGLGLAITEEVLRLMGEKIRVKYDNGKVRFTFTVTKYKA